MVRAFFLDQYTEDPFSWLVFHDWGRGRCHFIMSESWIDSTLCILIFL